MKKNSTKNNKGFTLLFAIIVSILVLSVGASLITLAIKQVRLSGSSRDSQFAFYASNTGIECALYWDFHPDADGKVVFRYTGSPSLYGATGDVTCDGYKIIDNPENGIEARGYSGGVSSFRIEFSDQEYCTDVIVEKTIRTTATGDFIDTKIVSNGYNTCDETNPRRIQRGLEINY